ncbi:DUF5946 family protein [Amycolatopsis sp. NPDC059021]|uniref:DUF5946 family protein n=1 Tax=Amycolatopsis sp. NPDC059021 TaxID=3346704 RepID=UPI00366EA0F5
MPRLTQLTMTEAPEKSRARGDRIGAADPQCDDERVQRCPGCGAPALPIPCDELFERLLALDHSRQAPWGPLHGVAVACFLLQHPSREPVSARPVRWALLHAFLRGGQAEVAALTQRARRLNSHRSGGQSPRVDAFPGAPAFPDSEPPTTFGTTIADVAGDGDFPAEHYADSVRTWAADTIEAWQARPGDQG